MVFKLGVIGTGWISNAFIEAAQMSGQYELTAVYSRSLTKALSFAEDFEEVELFDNLEEFVSYDLDVIYIASPNSLHFEQAKVALNAGKHVIAEKPAFSNPQEFEEIAELSVNTNTFVFEAARNIHEKAFQTVKDFLDQKTVTGAAFTYAKYSSKMPALLAGGLPNKWNPAFSGGILADLGVYLLYAAVGLFGKPEQVHYQAVKLDTGVDVSGNGLLQYKDFDVSIKCAGNQTSYFPSEIYTTDGTLILNGVSGIHHAKFVNFKGGKTELKLRPERNQMIEEARDFADIMAHPTDVVKFDRYETWLKIAHKVSLMSYQMRKEAGIIFEADK